MDFGHPELVRPVDIFDIQYRHLPGGLANHRHYGPLSPVAVGLSLRPVAVELAPQFLLLPDEGHRPVPPVLLGRPRLSGVNNNRIPPQSRLTALLRWILVIPHWIIVGILAEVVSILVLIALITVLITGAYPRTLFDFNMGLDRWRYRVSAYSMLLRDEYPPFSFDP